MTPWSGLEPVVELVDVLPVKEVRRAAGGGRLFLTSVELWSNAVRWHVVQTVPPDHRPFRSSPLYEMGDDVGTSYRIGGGGGSSDGRPGRSRRCSCPRRLQPHTRSTCAAGSCGSATRSSCSSRAEPHRPRLRQPEADERDSVRTVRCITRGSVPACCPYVWANRSNDPALTGERDRAPRFFCGYVPTAVTRLGAPRARGGSPSIGREPAYAPTSRNLRFRDISVTFVTHTFTPRGARGSLLARGRGSRQTRPRRCGGPAGDAGPRRRAPTWSTR